MDHKISLHDKSFRLYIPNAEIERAIDAVAEKLNRDYASSTDDNPAILICTLNGAVMFASELMKRLNFPLEFKACKLASYHGTHSTGVVTTELALPDGLEGRRVIVVEDIVDTGNTIVEIHSQLLAKGIKDARICTLLLKKDVYDKDIPLDYVALEIPNRFIVGFGLDYDQLGRNTKDIYVLDE